LTTHRLDRVRAEFRSTFAPGKSGMPNPFIDKLSGHAPLSTEDVKLLEEACGKSHEVPARHDLIREGDKPGPIFVILAGWACRYKMLPEGTRQITAFLMPGDCCDMHASVLQKMEHSIATLTPARVCRIPRARMEELILTRPALTRAFWWTQLVDEDTLRAWIVSMGRRNSLQRVAHLMCELYVRAHNIGLFAGDRFELPCKVLTHKFLLGELWDQLTDAQYLRVYVRQLRQKIEADPERPQFVLTETGVGYRLRAPDEIAKPTLPLET
jgi:CRP-like cAMP-binding protein